MGFGLEAAFLACLVTTTVGILGPGFFVPVAMGLLFIPLLLFLLFNFSTWQSNLLVMAIMFFLMLLHPPTAIIAIIAIAPFFLLNLRHDFKRSLAVAAMVVALALVTVPWLVRSSEIVSQVKSVFAPKGPILYHDIPLVVSHYGIIPVAVGLLGVFALVLRGGRKNYGLVLGLLAVTAMLTAFYTFGYGIGIMYLRGLLCAMLLLSMVGGAGLMELRRLRLLSRTPGRLGTPRAARYPAVGITVAIIVAALALAVPNRLSEPYYHMIDEQDHTAFVWIRDYVPPDSGKTIVDPWKGTAFSAIAGRPAYARIEAAPGANAYRAGISWPDQQPIRLS